MSRPSLGSHRAAPAAHRVLEAHQRRRSLGASATRTSASRASAPCSRAAVVSRSTASDALTLEAGDFVLLPATPGFTMSSFEPATPELIDPKADADADGRSPPRHARRASPTCACSAATSSSTRPMRRCWCRCCRRWCTCAASSGCRYWCGSSARKRASSRSGRDLVLSRLVEVLLIEALRSTPGEDAPPGLLRGLADARLAPAMRQMHGRSRASVDRGSAREDCRAFALGVLRALHPRRGPAADGIPARLAHGRREGSAPPPRRRARRGRRTRRLRLGEHLQHRVQPARRPAAEPLRASARELVAGRQASHHSSLWC